MTPDDLSAHLQAKAQHVANHLNALTPYERTLVLHQAQSIWDERDAKRAGELEAIEADSEETELVATAAWN